MKKITTAICILCAITAYGQDPPIPKNYTILTQAQGDLDNDSIAELAVAFNTPDSSDSGTERELQIFKKQGDSWVIWKKSRQAILRSGDGGMMGDPFRSIEIKQGVLIISQDGGSSWKWGYVDKYRFQNGEFELIGCASTFGKLCEYWEEVDFNLNTGTLIFKKEYESCENEEQKIYKKENETFSKKDIHLNLNNRQTGKTKIISPKYKHEIYL